MATGRRGERGREASKADNLRWDRPPARPDNKTVMFRVEGDNNRVRYSKFYFISVDSLFSVEPRIGEYNLVSRVPPFHSATIPLYAPRSCSPDLPPHLSFCCTAAIAEDCLFVIDGIHTTDVYSFDFINMDWVKRQNLSFRKYSPQAFGLEGKIYVFGTGDDLNGPLVEVYSPLEDKWDSASVEDLPFHEVQPILAVLTDTGSNSKHILVQPDSEDDTTDLYTYSMADKTFTLQERYRPFQKVYQSAVVDGILYCYREQHRDDRDNIVGYDLTGDHIWAPIPVLGFAPHLNFNMNFFQLLPLFDDTLCVLWMDSLINQNDKILVFVMTFKMSKVERNPATCMRNEPSVLLQATHVSSSCYQVPGRGGLSDCFVI